jgi:hypothetical protein
VRSDPPFADGIRSRCPVRRGRQPDTHRTKDLVEAGHELAVAIVDQELRPQVRGKGPRVDKLPPPADVGEALVDYLSRPSHLLSTAPVHSLMCSTAMSLATGDWGTGARRERPRGPSSSRPSSSSSHRRDRPATPRCAPDRDRAAARDARVAWFLWAQAACVLAAWRALVFWRLSFWLAAPRGISALQPGVVVLAVWALNGPVAPDWAQTAGTPLSLLQTAHPTPAGHSGAGRSRPACPKPRPVNVPAQE